jgi:hypothetical protein
MASTLNARLPHHVEQKLAEYCAKSGVNRSQAVVRALDEYLDREAGGANAYALAADLIPPKGVEKVQAGNVRELARKAFRGARPRR